MIYKVGDILQKEGMLDFHFEGMIGNIVFGYFQRPNGIKESDHYHIDELKDWKKKGERWKPKDGDLYFYVEIIPTCWGSKDWGGTFIDLDHYQSGNCFRTQEEVVKAAKKVKELLLSLHE